MLFNIEIKDLIFEILKRIDDKDILNVCLTCKCANSIINEEKYWMVRLFYLYGEHLKQLDVNRYRKDSTWKKYYIDLTYCLYGKFPSHQFAQAGFKGRSGILALLRQIRKLQLYQINTKCVLSTSQ